MSFAVKGVRIHVSFLFVSLIALYILFTPAAESAFFLLAVSLHELGHLLALFAFGAPPSGVELRSFGIRIVRRGMPLTAGRELIVLLAGPCVNLLLAALFFAASLAGLEALRSPALMNLMLALFNLFPVGCLDGGGILRCLLELRLSPRAADVVCLAVAIAFLLPLLVVGTLLLLRPPHTPSLLVTAVYLTATLLRDICR